MIELFRFIEQVFPPSGGTTNAGGIRLTGEQSPLQIDLLNLRSGPSPNASMAARAEQFLHSDGFPQQVTSLHFGQAYVDTWAKMRNALVSGAGMTALPDQVHGLFGASPTDLVGNGDFQQDRRILDDTLLALKFARNRAQIDSAPYAQARRALELVVMAAASKTALTNDELSSLIRQPFVIDSRLLPLPPDPTPPPPAPDPDTTSTQDHVDTLVQQATGLDQTWQALMALKPEDIELTAPAPTPTEMLVAPRALATSVQRPELRTPGPNLAAALYVRAETLQRLPDNVRSTLSTVGIDLQQVSLPRAVQAVKENLISTSNTLRPYLAPQYSRLYRVGLNLFAIKPGLSPVASGAAPSPIGAAVIKPMMVGNLQVVRQELLGYQTGEISHVENILRGETFERSTERQELSETTTIQETETTRTQERDTQSTERNELGPEASNVAGAGASSGPGQMASQAYGTLVENRQSQYGKEVTDKAVTNVTDRVREQRIQREQKLFVEKTRHMFTNADGAGNISGIYQWLDKKLAVRVLNYGQRLLYDVVVPEPAAFFLDSLKSAQPVEGYNLVKPDPPSKLVYGTGYKVLRHSVPLAPADLNAGNYLDYAATYGATASLEPPPADFQTTVVWPNSGQAPFTHRADKITIPQGYVAIRGYWQSTNWWDDNGNCLNGNSEISIGDGSHYYKMDYLSGSFAMNGETGDLPVTFGAGGMKGWNVAVGVVCKNDTAYQSWQIKTYTAILDGYKRLLADYESRLAALQTAMRTQLLFAQNADQNAGLERTELKRAFVELLLSEYYSKVGIPTPNPTAIPQDVLATMRWGAVVAFFERAFEWDNMMYTYYPYYWGRQARWGELVLIQDLNPDFEAFLKAGAARVVVPVRPGFEGAVAHYQETGDIWFGKDMPDMFSELYVSIVDEIASRNVAFGQERCVQQWDVILPTTLVMLRNDASLPEWTSTVDCQPEPDV